MLESEFKAAVSEIETMLDMVTVSLLANGWAYYTTDNAPEKFSELKKFASSKKIPIANYGSNLSIYSSNEYNEKFRFWHDVLHIVLDSGFSLVGEEKVIVAHLDYSTKYGLSFNALQVLKADTLGQVHYYFKNKRFVKNQKAFVQEYIKKGNVALGFTF